MDYKRFLHSKFIQEHGGVLDDEIPNTYDLWVESLTEEQKMMFLRQWEGLATSTKSE